MARVPALEQVKIIFLICCLPAVAAELANWVRGSATVCDFFGLVFGWNNARTLIKGHVKTGIFCKGYRN